MIDGFKAIGGYESLSSLILTTSDRDVQDAVISFLEKLVYIGGRDMLAELQPREAFHFQHSDFRLPPDNGGPCVRNRNAFSALTETFLRATNIDAPAHFHAAGDHISKVLMGVLRTNPLNYFILESSGAIISLVEKLDTMRLSGQEETLRLLEFALIDVNYVPFKELACLCVYFTHNSTSSTTAFVADWLVKLLSRSKRLASNFRDIGMVSMLANMVKELATSLRDLSRSGRNAGDPSGTISLVDVGEPRAPDALPRKLAPRFAPIILDNFEAMMRLALKLLEGDRESCLMWTRSSKGALVDLLPVDELRGPLLRIIRTITTVRTAGPSSPSTVDPDRDLNKILELILSAPARNVLLKADLLEAFGEIMATSPLLRETFRTSGGFATCIQVLSGLEGAFLRALPFPDDKDLDRTEATTKVEEPSILRDLAPSSALSVDLASCARLSFSCLKVLLGAIKNDDTARGLLVVELDSVVQTFRLSGILQTLYAAGLVGSLFALALEDSSLQMLFVSNFWESTSDPTGASSTDVASTVTMPVSEADASSVMAQQTSALRNNMARSSRVLRNPAVLVPILSLLPDLGGQAPAQLAYGSLVAMHGLSLGNRGNQARMGGTGMLMRLLKDLYSSDGRLSGHPGQQRESHLGRSRFSDQCRDVARILAMRLLEIGIASEDELRYLFEQANPDLPWLRDDPAALNDIADVLLHGVKYGRTPSHVHFDHRSSSISGLATGLAECGSGLFPSYGWSLSVWIRVHDFDPLGNVNVVTILPDGEGSPVLSVVIEGRSRKVMVQAGNSQMLFENFALRPRKWYHMVIVHSRSRMSQMTSSSITLSIDGIVAENARFAYPNPSPRIKEAIFGIVAEEASSGPSQLVWDLGTCHFLADCLDPDSVNIIYNLGPQYRGNFQDSLKKYQTYEIIDSVNLDYVNHGNEDGTDLGHLALATAVVRCGGSPVTEDQILFTLSASNEIADYDGRQLARSPQKQRNVLVNSSHPRDLHLADWSSVNSMAGVARLYGNAVRMSPNRVVDGVWRIGGCALIVSFIEKLQTPELLLKGISILVESIRFNWRNTEDMEKEHLYEAFANILRDRVELLTPEAVEQLLVLVGKLPNLPTEAVLSNTMAYRFLFLDFELWRKASRDIQKLVLSQFQDFTVRSRKRVFNAKRLGKLFLTKRLLMALRTEVFGPTLLPDVVKVIRSTLIASFNVDSVRAIATFIMSTLPQSSDAVTASSVQEEDWSSRQRVSSRDDWQRRGRSGSVVAALGAPGRIASFATEFSRQRKVSTMYSAADGEVGNFVPLRRGRLPSTLGITTEPTRSAARFDLRGSMLPPLVADAQADEAKYSMPQAVTEMRNLLLECLVDIVCCEPGDNPFVSNFAQMITARWFLLFVDTRTSSRTVVLGRLSPGSLVPIRKLTRSLQERD